MDDSKNPIPDSFEIYSIEFDPETLETTVNGGMKCPALKTEKDDLGFKMGISLADMLGLKPDPLQIENAKATLGIMESIHKMSTHDFIDKVLNGINTGVPTQDSFQWVRAVDILKAVNHLESR